ncbi:MAG: hypothetical protein ACRENP_24610 [Longimicrobiales bacterium]
MRSMKWMVSGALCLAVLVPAREAAAQSKKIDALNWLFKIPRWNADLHAGFGNYGRFLLESPVEPFDFLERELRGRGAFTIGVGFGGTFMPRTGFRLGVNRTWSELAWRDDTGTGSELLDQDDVGDLAQTILSAEIVRYLLLESSKFTPYATAGVLASWWGLNDATGFIGDDTHFRWGATGSIGLQLALRDNIRLRLDATTASIGNPFTGRNSYIADLGRAIDEPSRVRKTEVRLAVGYAWGKPHAPVTTDGGKGSR